MKKEYEVLFDMECSHTFHVKADGKIEAKKKAFEKMKKKAVKISNYSVDVELW